MKRLLYETNRDDDIIDVGKDWDKKMWSRTGQLLDSMQKYETVIVTVIELKGYQ